MLQRAEVHHKRLSEQNLVILKEMMKKYKFISVRDSHTYDYVKNLYDGKMVDIWIQYW